MKSGTVVLLLVSSAIVGVGGFLSWWQARLTAQFASQNDQRERAIDERLARLSNELDRLRERDARSELAAARLARENGSRTDIPSATSQPRERDEPTVESGLRSSRHAAPEEARAIADANFAAFGQRLRSESRDPGWASLIEMELLSSIKSMSLTGVNVTKSSCSSTICMLEMSGGTDDNFRQFSRELPERIPYMTQSAARTVEDDRGRTKIVAYLSREGHSLPWQASN